MVKFSQWHWVPALSSTKKLFKIVCHVFFLALREWPHQTLVAQLVVRLRCLYQDLEVVKWVLTKMTMDFNQGPSPNHFHQPTIYVWGVLKPSLQGRCCFCGRLRSWMIPSFGEGVGRKLQLDALLIYESTRPYPFWKMNHELCLVTQNTVGMVPKLLYNFQLPHYPFEGLHDISWLNLGVSHLKESTVFHARGGPFPTSVEDTHPSPVYRQRYGFRLREQRSDAILCKQFKFNLCEFLVYPSIIEDFFRQWWLELPNLCLNGIAWRLPFTWPCSAGGAAACIWRALPRWKRWNWQHKKRCSNHFYSWSLMMPMCLSWKKIEVTGESEASEKKPQTFLNHDLHVVLCMWFLSKVSHDTPSLCGSDNILVDQNLVLSRQNQESISSNEHIVTRAAARRALIL